MAIPDTVVSTVTVTIIFTLLAFVAVCLRMYTRLILVRHPGADDYFMMAAMIVSIGYLVVVMLQVKYGLGTPFLSIPNENKEKFFQSLWATIPTYNLALVLCKLSIILQYMRVFPIPFVRKICLGMLALLAAYGCWTVFGSIFMCIPVQFFWGVGQGTCMNRLVFWFTNAALNIATDIIICVIPMPLVRKLQITKKQKIALMFVFACGLFVCVTSVIRLQSLYIISIGNDTSMDGVSIAMWTGVEMNVAITSASVPAIKALIQKAFPHLLSSFQGTRTGRSGYANMELEDTAKLRSTRSHINSSKLGHSVSIKTEVKVSSRDGSQRSIPAGMTSTDCWATDEHGHVKGTQWYGDEGDDKAYPRAAV